jgi:type II secretory pathway component GspD/PulD (secretin)
MRNPNPLFYQLLSCLFGLVLYMQPATAYEALGTVEFKSATVGDASRVISELAKVNIVVTEAAKDKTVSLYLKQATVESAVDSLCRVSGLWYRKNSEFNVYYIMTEEEFDKDIVVEKDYSTRIFELKHQNVSDAANAIESLFGDRVDLSEPRENSSYELDGDFGGGGSSGSGGSGNNSNNNNRSGNNNRNDRNNNSSNGSSGADNDTVESRRAFFNDIQLDNANRVIVQESELVKTNVRSEPPIYVTWNSLHNLLLLRTSDKQALRDIAQLIKRIDQPAQQVLLEMKILRVTLGDEERSIFDYSYQQGQIQTGIDDDDNPTFVPRVDIGLGNFPLEGGAFLAQLTSKKLAVTIEWLKTENRINLVAQPNIIAANNKEAKLTIGEDRVIVTGASSDVVTNDSSTIITIDLETETRIIGTELTIWPRINGDKTVTLDIEQSNTTLNEQVSNLPISTGGSVTNVPIDSVSESSIELTAIARHGATIAIGGMIENRQQEIHEKVPLLGDLPGIGKIFRKDVTSNTRSELIVLITPWVSNNPVNTHEVTQARVKTWSDSPDMPSHLITPEEKNLPVSWPTDIREKAITALRYAVSADQQLATSCQNGQPYSAPRFSDWKLNEFLQVDALQHCQTSNFILTKAQVHNLSDRTQQLRPDLFKQGWIASQGESAILQPGESHFIYLVSATPPEQLLRNQQEKFFYGEGAINAQ